MLLPCSYNILYTYLVAQEKELPCDSCHAVTMQLQYWSTTAFCMGICGTFHMFFAAQEEELPLNILCRLCCQWKLPSCICRTGNRIAAVQQLKFHFWAGLFSQRLSVSVLIKVLSWIPLASPLTSNDRLLPLKHNWDMMQVGKMCEVVDVQMDVNVVAMLLPFSWKILHTYLAVQEKELPLTLGVVQMRKLI